MSPLGITKTDASGEKGKHMTSFVYVLTFLWFKYPDRAPLRRGMEAEEPVEKKQTERFLLMEQNTVKQ